MKRLIMGNEAMALGAVEAGVEVVTAYPGTPSSEIVGTLAKMAEKYGYYVEWSTNEKVALEVAAGASYAGARGLVAMKQVGLNVASDALMSLAYIGVKGGLVLVVADDPGPHSSQTEQDTRVFGKFAKIPVFNPTTPQEAKEMVVEAFNLSEAEGMPVLVRPTTRVCHGCAGVTIDDNKLQRAGKRRLRVHRFERDPKWIIFPKLSYERHQWLVAQEKKLAQAFSTSPFNEIITFPGKELQDAAGVRGSKPRLGLITSGVAHCYAMEALERMTSGAIGSSNPIVLKIGTTNPLPVDLILDFAGGVDEILVVEEQDPYLEEAVRNILHQAEVNSDARACKVFGKETGDLPYAGEYTEEIILKAIYRLGGADPEGDSVFGDCEGEAETAAALAKKEAPTIPVRPPVFCAGCPHRASFYLFKEAAKGKDAVFTGDIGCYTLGNAPPLSALDTCLCMGAGVTIALGLAKAEPDRPHVGFVGDSTFFHSCLTGLVNAVYNRTKITLVVLDNSTTAMTGHQPHPGLGISATGAPAPAINIAQVCSVLGVEYVREVSPFDFDEFKKTAVEAMDYHGPSVVVAKAPCVAVSKPEKKYYIDRSVCKNCGLCLTKIGCPAISCAPAGSDHTGEEKPLITGTCRGCGLCALVCPKGAIKEVSAE